MEPAWLQILLGAAAATTVIGALFAAGNAWMMRRIRSTVKEGLNGFKDELLETLEEKYVPRREYELMEKHAAEIHGRHDDDIKDIWKHVNPGKGK